MTGGEHLGAARRSARVDMLGGGDFAVGIPSHAVRVSKDPVAATASLQAAAESMGPSERLGAAARASAAADPTPLPLLVLLFLVLVTAPGGTRGCATVMLGGVGRGTAYERAVSGRGMDFGSGNPNRWVRAQPQACGPRAGARGGCACEWPADCPGRARPGVSCTDCTPPLLAARRRLQSRPPPRLVPPGVRCGQKGHSHVSHCPAPRIRQPDGCKRA